MTFGKILELMPKNICLLPALTTTKEYHGIPIPVVSPAGMSSARPENI
jgi:hypothetical protein